MSSPVNVGDILAGKYQVERVLGVGGMGVVVAAKHLTLGERVAIKFLLPQALAREDVVKRFIQEGRAANRLRGEHVARVHDVGRLESGAPFLVMEYLDGSDLGAVLREKGPMSVESAVDYVMQACEALAEAHSANIIHRDLKPSNLFLIKRLDGSPSIKLIDFGISKIQVPGSDGPEGEMTATAVMMGSPLYMAPEQMASARDVDGRSDIWSLGIILHTMLTGSPPFRAPSVMQVYELIVQGAPPIRKQRADVPEAIEATILKCLQKDRRQRYGNVGELADAIAEFGPPESRFVASRINRIISARATQPSIPSPESVAPPPVATITPASLASAGIEAVPASKLDPGQGDGTPPPSNLNASQSSSSAIDPLGTDGAWDQKTHPPSKRARPLALIAAVAAALIGAPVAFLVLRSEAKPPVSPPTLADALDHRPSASAGQAGLAPPTVSVDPVPPSVLPATSATAPTASTPSGRPSADPAAPPVSHAGHRQGGAPPSPAAHHAKSPDDLFGTQK